MRQRQTCFKRNVRTSSIIIPSLVELGYRAPPGGGAKKFNVFCLFFVFCLSVTLLNDKVCERHFAMKALEYGNDIFIVGQGNVCNMCIRTSTLFLQCWVELRQNDKVENW